MGPEYQQAADVIKSKITSGEHGFGIGDTLTIGQIQAITGATYSTARAATDQLKTEGVLEGRQGVGFYVRATPMDAASERMSVKELSEEVAELAELVKGNDDLRARVGRIEAILISWSSRLGYENPFGGTSDATEKAPRRGRAGR